MDTAGNIKNMAGPFNSYATIEMVLYERHGSEKTETTVKLNQMGDPLKYFNDDGSLLKPEYGNCYGLPLGQKLTIQGSPKTQD